MVRVLPHVILALAVLTTAWSAGCHTPATCPLIFINLVEWQQEGMWAAMPEPGRIGNYTIRESGTEGFSFSDPTWGELKLAGVSRAVSWPGVGGTLRTQIGITHPAILGGDHNETDRAQVAMTALSSVPEERLRQVFVEFVGSLSPAAPQQIDGWADAFIASRAYEGPGVTPPEESGVPPPPSSEHAESFHVWVDPPFLFEEHYAARLYETHMTLRPDPWATGEVELGEWSYRFAIPSRVATLRADVDATLIVNARDHAEFKTASPILVDGEFVGFERQSEEEFLRMLHNALDTLGLPRPDAPLPLRYGRPAC